MGLYLHSPGTSLDCDNCVLKSSQLVLCRSGCKAVVIKLCQLQGKVQARAGSSATTITSLLEQRQPDDLGEQLLGELQPHYIAAWNLIRTSIDCCHRPHGELHMHQLLAYAPVQRRFALHTTCTQMLCTPHVHKCFATLQHDAVSCSLTLACDHTVTVDAALG